MSKDEESLWAFVTRSVKKLSPQPSQRAHSPRKEHTAVQKPATSEQLKTSPRPQKTTQHKAHNIFNDSDIDRATYRKLKRGDLNIDATLDLHGLDQARAHEVLNRFIAQSYAHNARVVLVITGRGRGMASDHITKRVMREGVLRGALPGWLDSAPNRDKILKMMPAAPKDGGAGAFYVMLKRKR